MTREKWTGNGPESCKKEGFGLSVKGWWGLKSLSVSYSIDPNVYRNLGDRDDSLVFEESPF